MCEPDYLRSMPMPPLVQALIEAGFASPADDWIEESLDLNRRLVKTPSATFFIRVKGDSMIGAGIHEGDLLVVDRSVQPAHNHIVIAVVDGGFTVKRLHIEGTRIELRPENPAYAPIAVAAEGELQVWGVVTFSIHGLHNVRPR